MRKFSVPLKVSDSGTNVLYLCYSCFEPAGGLAVESIGRTCFFLVIESAILYLGLQS